MLEAMHDPPAGTFQQRRLGEHVRGARRRRRAIDRSSCCGRQPTGSDLSSTDTYSAIVAALDRLLQANISAGTLRLGLDAEDVILADPASDSRAKAQRMYDIALGGLQRPPQSV